MKNHEQNATRLQERETQLAEAKFREQGLNDELYETRNKQRQLESELMKLHETKVTSDTRAVEKLKALNEQHEQAISRLSEQG